jgi:ribosomal protein L34E
MIEKERPFEQKKCPKCGSTFTCSASAKCWCFEYEVPSETMEMIQDKYQGCLCPDCLKSFAKPV